MADKEVKKISKKVMSHRGEVVDFDVLRLKEQIKSGPKSDAVVQRERFIDKKRRRTAGARKVNEILAEQAESQRYAKEMIDAQRAAKKIDDADKASQEPAPVVAEDSTPAPVALPELDRPKRINRRVR